MHIPKTAGTSVLIYMRKVYEGRKKLELRHQDNTLQTVSGEDVMEAEYIWLHEPLMYLKYNTDCFFKFTFLRDPVDRARSVYLYLRNPSVIDEQDFSHTPEWVVKSLRVIEQMSFEEFVCSDDPVHVGHITGLYAQYFVQEGYAMTSRENYLSHCIERMETSFDYIGLTSKLSDDMNVIAKTCFPEHQVPFGDLRANVSEKSNVDVHLSNNAMDVLRRKLDLDFDIYEYACRMREGKYHALKGSEL